MTNRRELLSQALEACRLEIVRRLKERRLPLSIKTQQMVVIDDPDKQGWRSDWQAIQVSSLRSTQIALAVRDDSIPFLMPAMREQLLPLAEFLDTTTDLGTRTANILPALTGIDAILARYLGPLATHYLTRLRALHIPRPSLVDSLASDLDLLCHTPTVVRASQLPLEGVRVHRAFTYRGVTLRPLSPRERGALLETQQPGWSENLADTSDFIVPQRFEHFAPTVLVETEVTRSRGQADDESRLPYRVALAFFLSGIKVGSRGVLVSFDRPRWAAMGFAMSYAPFPVSEKVVFGNQRVSFMELRGIVDLAHRIPTFGAEGSGRDVALFRVLRGCGMHWQESGFLDFAIALEAALLGGVRTELAYRFSLHGALFLRDQLDPNNTFDRLKNIYDVRSRLVHGDRVSATDRAAAERDAAELAVAIVGKAVRDGWPKSDVLNKVALAGTRH